MVRLTRANNTTGTQAPTAAPSTGRPPRTGSAGPGPSPHALTEAALAATEASLTQERERRLAEVRLRSSE